MTSTSGYSDMANQLDQIKDLMSGEKSVNYRLDSSKQFSQFVLTSTKRNITNSTYYVNEYGIPTSGSNLDITFPTSSTLLGVASTSANDTSVGTGARTLQIEGLNSNYDPQTEVITLNGQTRVNTTKQFLRVNGATVLTAGTSRGNEGTIYISNSTQVFTLGIPQTLVYRSVGIDPLDNKGIGVSTPGTYTIPRGWTACPLNFKVDTDATDAKPLLVRGIVRPQNGIDYVYGNLVFNGSPVFIFDSFGTVPEKSDLIIRSAKKTANNVDTGVVYWEFVMRKNKFIKSLPN